MSMEYKVSAEGVGEQTFDPDYLAEQLTAQGEQVLSVSPDGMSIELMGSQGPFKAAIPDILAKNGWQVQQSMPSNADYSMADPQFRAAINLMPDDASRQRFIAEVMQNRGLPNAQIHGQGRDWFVFDPESNQYYGVTNNPEWDKTDLVEAGIEGYAGAGQIVGGGLGAMLGGVPGMVIGSALGGAGARSDMRGKAMVANQFLGEGEMIKALAADPMALPAAYGREAVLDAGTAALGPVLGKAAGPVAQKVFQSGPVSTVAKGLGWAGENIGRGVEKAAGFVADSRLGKELASYFVPGAGDAVMAGWGAQIPKAGVEAIPTVAEKVGGFVGRAFPGAGEKMTAFGRMAGAPRNVVPNASQAATQTAEDVGAFFAGQAKPVRPDAGTAETILGNIGEWLGSKTASLSKEAKRALYQYNRKFGLGAQDAYNLAKQVSPADSSRLAEEIVATAGVKNPQQVVNTMRRPSTWARAGEKIGRGVDTLANAGRAVENTGIAVTGAGLRAAQGAGMAMSKGGLAAKLGGTVMSPLENRMYVRYGSEEALSPYFERRPWQQAQTMDKMYLANQQ